MWDPDGYFTALGRSAVWGWSLRWHKISAGDLVMCYEIPPVHFSSTVMSVIALRGDSCIRLLASRCCPPSPQSPQPLTPPPPPSPPPPNVVNQMATRFRFPRNLCFGGISRPLWFLRCNCEDNLCSFTRSKLVMYCYRINFQKPFIWWVCILNYKTWSDINESR